MAGLAAGVNTMPGPAAGVNTMPVPAAGVNKYSIPTLIGDYMGWEEEDLPVKQAYTGHYIAKQTGCATNPSRFLDCTTRPSNVQSTITLEFNSVRSNNTSTWGLYNGDAHYYRCGIDETALLKTMIQEGYAKGQKVFTLLDIGAGNFQWGDSMRRFILAQDLPKDITVRIISVRGEQNNHVEEWSSGQCKMYEFGDFKVENLIEEFKKRGLDLEGQVDMIVSRWCFPHLVDPLKTFGQAYNLLRPETGCFLGDGFYFFTNDQAQPDWAAFESMACRKINMLRLLVDIKAPMLMQGSGEKIDQFIIQRLDDHPCELDMRFIGLEYRKNYDTSFHKYGADTVCRYTRLPQDYEDKLKVVYPGLYSGCSLSGSKDLHDWLKARKLVGRFQEWNRLLQPVDDRLRELRDTRESLEAAADRAVHLAEQVDAALRAKEAEDLLKSETERTDAPQGSNNGFGAVTEWLSMGDCVILRSPGYSDLTYFQGSATASLEDRRVILVHIDPATHLLDEGEWPAFLEAYKYKLATPEFKKRIFGCALPHFYEFTFPASR